VKSRSAKTLVGIILAEILLTAIPGAGPWRSLSRVGGASLRPCSASVLISRGGRWLLVWLSQRTHPLAPRGEDSVSLCLFALSCVPALASPPRSWIACGRPPAPRALERAPARASRPERAALDDEYRREPGTPRRLSPIRNRQRRVLKAVVPPSGSTSQRGRSAIPCPGLTATGTTENLIARSRRSERQSTGFPASAREPAIRLKRTLM
jgi:hypothetical protein